MRNDRIDLRSRPSAPSIATFRKGQRLCQRLDSDPQEVRHGRETVEHPFGKMRSYQRLDPDDVLTRARL